MKKRILTKISEDTYKITYEGTSWFDLCNEKEAYRIMEENKRSLNVIQ